MAGIVEYFFFLANEWLKLILTPVSNPDMLWLILPVYLNWFVNEYFQERKGTSLGNAIANGFTLFWVGSDFIRTLVKEYMLKSTLSLSRAAASIIIIGYGSLIMVEGIRGKKITRYIGRVREVTYIIVMTIPIFYKLVDLTIDTVVAILLFFPIFYLITEIIDRLLPPPKAELEDSSESQPAPQPPPEYPPQPPAPPAPPA